MSSFYGGKEGRTYHIVERYDVVSLKNLDKTGFTTFVDNTTYSKGDKLAYNGEYYVVLADTISSSSDLLDKTKVAHIKGMIQQFAKGGAYTDANYGQYVIIDTIKNLNRKSDLENGLLYRRGFDYNDIEDNYPKPDKSNDKYYDNNNNLLENKWQADWSAWVQNPGAGAIYVGQIVGAQGDSPQLTPVNWNTIKDNAKVKIIAPTSTTRGDEITPSSTMSTPSGTVYKGDTIKIASLTNTDSDGNVTGAQIAFDIPTTIFEPGDIDTDPYTDPSFTENPASTAHPFYYKWDFKVPGGKQGTDVYEMKLWEGKDIKKALYPDWNPDASVPEYITVQDWEYKECEYTDIIRADVSYYIKQGQEYIDVTSYASNQIGNPITNLITALSWSFPGNYNYYTYELVEKTIPNPNYGNTEADSQYDPASTIINNDWYITYTLKDYTTASTGTLSKPQGIWPYRVIEKITPVSKERGNIIGPEEWKAGSTIPIGTLYKTSEYPDNRYWICVKSGIIDDANRQPKSPDILGYQDESLGRSGAKMVWRVVDIPQETPPHTLKIEYKAGQDDPISNLRNVDYLTVDKDGKMYVFYTDNDNPNYLTTVRELQYIEIDDNINNEDYGKIKIKYTDSTSPSVLYDPNILENITFKNQDNIVEPQVFSAKYKKYNDPNTEIDESEKNISDPLNRILAIDRYGDNLICLYSDPTFRAASTVGKTKDKDYYILDWTDPINNKSYTNLVWQNFGPIGAQHHFQGKYTYDDLKTTYANGFGSPETGTEDRAGWVAMVQYQGTVKLYAYDYNENNQHKFPDETPTHWYQVMSVAESVVANPEYSILVSEKDSSKENPTPKEDASKLKENGIWFVVSGGHD